MKKAVILHGTDGTPQDHWIPWLKTANWYETGQFDGLFPVDGFDIQYIQSKAKKHSYIHGDDDPYCDYGDANHLAEKLKADFITIKNGKHLSGSSGIKALPEVLTVLENRNNL